MSFIRGINGWVTGMVVGIGLIIAIAIVSYVTTWLGKQVAHRDRVVISGYYGFANAGDEAMLAAIVGSLKDIIPDVSITVITGNCRMTRENHNVQAVHRLNFFAIAAAIRRCDILISGGGSLLQDVTSARSLYYYLWIMKIALFFKKPVMLYAQGIGPVRGAKARRAVRKVLQRVAVIGVRDADSKAELAAMGVTKPPVT